MPVYKITDTSDDTVRLVKAENQSRALKHAAEERFKISVPDTEEVAELVAEGVTLERAVPPVPRTTAAPQD